MHPVIDVRVAVGRAGSWSNRIRFRIEPADSSKDITAFSFGALSPPAVGVIDQAAGTIAVTVPHGTDVTALVATFTTTGTAVAVGATAQTSGATANDFTHAVTYRVTAADGSTRDYVVTVTVAGSPATKFLVTMSGGTTPLAAANKTAGTPFNVRVTAQDAGGATDPGFTGDVDLTSNAFTGHVTATISAGGYVDGVSVTPTRAGTARRVAAAGGGITTTNASGDFVVVAGAPATMASNGGDGQSAVVHTAVATAPSVIVHDAYGNVVSGVSVDFAVTAGGGAVTGGSAITDASGIATVGSWRLGDTAGANSLGASHAGLTGSPVGFTATGTPGAATHLKVTAPASATAGTAFDLTVTAQDAYDNTDAGYVGTVHFTSTDTGASTALPTDYTFAPGDNGTHAFTSGATLTTAGDQTITATDTVTASITGTSGTIAVAAGAATHLKVTAPASATAGTAFDLTVTAQDAYDNTATGYVGTVHFTSTDTGASTALPADYTFAPGDNGTHAFTSGATLTTAGDQTITATDTVTASITGTSGTIAVAHGPLDHFTFATISSPQQAGVAFSATITAKDAYGNTITDLAGTTQVDFTTNHGAPTAATVSPSHIHYDDFTSGVYTGNLTVAHTGLQVTGLTITATSAATGNPAGTSNSFTLSPAAAPTFVAGSFAANDTTIPIGSRTCTIPTGTQEGDIVFALIQAHNDSTTAPTLLPASVPAVPAGAGTWYKLGDHSDTQGSFGWANYYALYYLNVGATLPTTDTWTFSPSVSYLSVTNATYRGAVYDTVANGGTDTSTNATLTAPTITPSGDGEYLVFIGNAHAYPGSVTVTTGPTGFTTNTNSFANHYLGYFALTNAAQASGASGAKTATLSASSDRKHGFMVALKTK